MKKSILLFVTSLLFVNVFAQKADHKRATSAGITIFGSDFVTGTEIKNNNLSYAIRKGSLFNKSRLKIGIGLNYLKGLTNQVDFVSQLSGSFVDYPLPTPLSGPKTTRFLLDVTGGLNVKLLPDNYTVVPFANFGVGFSKYTSHYAAFVPVGLGLQFNVTDAVFFSINSQYRMPVTENAAGHVYHGISLYTVVGKKK